MTGWSVPLRIARRESLRRPWRSLLVLLLVAVPVAGTTIASVLARTDARTPVQRWDDEFGDADVVTYGLEPGHDPVTDLELDPASILAEERFAEDFARVRSDRAAAQVHVRSIDGDSPLWAGRFTTVAGRSPASAGEVALSPRLAEAFGVSAGDTLVLARPQATLDVVGVVEDRSSLRSEHVHVAPGVPSPLPGIDLQIERVAFDLGTPTDAELQPLLFANADVRPLPSLERFAPDAGFDTVTWSVVIGALVLAVLGIVIAAAFAAGGRSQLVSLGLLSANGASPAVLRRVLVLQGTVTGAVGTLAGLGCGALALGFGHGLAEQALGRRLGGYAVGASELLAIAAIGVAGATVAALVPSRTVAAVPTLTALAGRRPVAAVRPRFTVGGLVTMGGGFMLLVVAATGAAGGQGGDTFAAVAIFGGLAMLFGAAALTPAMVERLEPLARRTDGSVRLALRGLARNRVRSGAIVAAVAAAGALAVGAASVAPVAGEDLTYLRLHPDVVEVSKWVEEAGTIPPAVVADVASALDDPVIHHTEILETQVDVRGVRYGFLAGEVLVLDPAAAPDLGLSAAAVRSITEDGVVVLAFSPRPDQRVSLSTSGSVVAEGELTFSPYGILQWSGLLVSPEVADRLGGVTRPGPVYVTDRSGIDDLERFDLTDIADPLAPYRAEASPTEAEGVAVTWNEPATRFASDLLVPVLTAVAVAFALLVVGIGLALAAADDRADRRLLSVVGAGPRTLSGISGAQAAVLALLGLLLAVPLGHLPALALQSGVRLDVVEFPVRTVALLLLGVPPAAYAGARVATAVSQRLRPLRLSASAFD